MACVRLPKTLPPSLTTPTAPTRWVWPSRYDALDRLEREVVEDVAAAILAAKVARRDASDAIPGPRTGSPAPAAGAALPA